MPYAEFTQALEKELHRPTLFPVPEIALQLGFGEMSEIMLASQRVNPSVAPRSGDAFRHTKDGEALAAALRPAGASFPAFMIR